MTFEQYSLLWNEGFKAFKSGEESLPNLRLHDYEEVKAWLMGYYAAKKEQNNCKTVHYTAVTPEDVIRIQEVASEALGLLKQRLNPNKEHK